MTPAAQAPPTPHGLPAWACRLLAGLDAGTLAAAAVLAWFALFPLARGEFWWSRFNLAGAPFYGERVFFMGLSRASLAGAAFLFLAYSLLGIVFALLSRASGLFRAMLLGVLWMMLWHLFAQRLFWRWLDSSAPSYFTQPATLPAHLAAGILLGRVPGRLRAFARLAGNASWPAAMPAPSASGLCADEHGAAGPPAETTPPPARPASTPDC